MLHRYPKPVLALAVVVFLLGSTSPAAAQGSSAGTTRPGTENQKDSYFLLLFSQDRDPPAPRFSHTYAAFVHAQRERGGKRYRLETHTISWMPATLDVRLIRRPEQGVNLTLKQSLDNSLRMDTRISMWGPYQIRKELFERAVRQEKRLKSGTVAYKALDGGVRADGAGENCFHAVADVDTDRGLLETGRAYGADATQMVAGHLRRWIIDPQKTYSWVADRLGVNRYPVVRRAFNGDLLSRRVSGNAPE